MPLLVGLALANSLLIGTCKLGRPATNADSSFLLHLGLATLVVFVVAGAAVWVFFATVPTSAELMGRLRLLVFALCAVVLGQLAELALPRLRFGSAQRPTGLFGLLTAVNGMALWFALEQVQDTASPFTLLLSGLAFTAVFFLLLLSLLALRAAADRAAVPLALRGPALDLITAGLLILICTGMWGAN